MENKVNEWNIHQIKCRFVGGRSVLCCDKKFHLVVQLCTNWWPPWNNILLETINSALASQEILNILWNLSFHYCVYKALLVILGHTLPSCFLTYILICFHLCQSFTSSLLLRVVVKHLVLDHLAQEMYQTCLLYRLYYTFHLNMF